ncbi:peptidase [Agromyces sp. Marseille-Q5079]|uniref:peptidase n=1 Tax=Agromyces sp. Marseille-Q5079 TaxID=3439059 RepID=UPI003D9C8F90
MIDWGSFLLVLVASLVSACVIVSAYALGIRLLTVSGRTPIVSPAEFTDAITIVSPAEIRKAEKRAAKAARKSPLTDGQKRMALVGAWACFVVSALAVVYGVYLIIGDHVLKMFS